MIGEESGMYNNNPVSECLYERAGHLPKEAGQDDEGRSVLVDLVYQQGFVEALPGDDKKRYVLIFRYFQHSGICLVADYEGNSGQRTPFEVIYNGLSV
jgi:hypothetical protein